jgi:phage gp29-like protein
MPRLTLKQLQSLATIPASKVPTSAETITNALSEPDSFLEWMDPDRVGMAIRSARGGNTQPLFAIYRDIVGTHAHIQSELHKRKIAVLGEPFKFQPYDKKKRDDVVLADFCEKSIYSTRSWRRVCTHLLDSCLWPVSVGEKVFAPDGSRFVLSDLICVPHHLLDFSTGFLRITDVDATGKPLGTSHDPDPLRYIIHRGHTLSSPDTYGGPMRALIYWWLASVMSRDWWIRFLDRYGSPFIVGKFKPGCTSDRDILVSAMSAAKRLFGLAISTSTTVELIEATKSSADAFERFNDVANREISKLVVGQSLSAQASPTGEIGGGTAGLQGDVREDIRRYDAAMLCDTIRDQLLANMCALSTLPGVTPTCSWGSVSPEVLTAKATLLTSLASARLELDDAGVESISEDTGLSLRRISTPAYQ